MTRDPLPHLVIIGGGFAGLWATRALASSRIRITLVDRRNHHLFQPLLYQVATAGLSAPDIAAPLRHILGQSQPSTPQHGITSNQVTTAGLPRLRCTGGTRTS